MSFQNGGLGILEYGGNMPAPNSYTLICWIRCNTPQTGSYPHAIGLIMNSFNYHILYWTNTGLQVSLYSGGSYSDSAALDLNNGAWTLCYLQASRGGQVRGGFKQLGGAWTELAATYSAMAPVYFSFLNNSTWPGEGLAGGVVAGVKVFNRPMLPDEIEAEGLTFMPLDLDFCRLAAPAIGQDEVQSVKDYSGNGYDLLQISLTHLVDNPPLSWDFQPAGTYLRAPLPPPDYNVVNMGLAGKCLSMSLAPSMPAAGLKQKTLKAELAVKAPKIDLEV